jgi:hypothetical protein
MTHDFIDQFSDALEAEKRGYLIAVHNGAQAFAKGGAHIRTDFEHWPDNLPDGRTKEHDVLLAITAAFAGDGQAFTILTEEQRQAVLGALDSLGTVLANYGHTWTAGERAVYEQAIEVLKVKVKDEDSDE